MKKRVVVYLLIASVWSGAVSGSVFAGENGETQDHSDGIAEMFRIPAGAGAALSTLLALDGRRGFRADQRADKGALRRFQESAVARAERAREIGSNMKVYFSEEAKELKGLKKNYRSSSAKRGASAILGVMGLTYALAGPDRIEHSAEKVSDLISKATKADCVGEAQRPETAQSAAKAD